MPVLRFIGSVLMTFLPPRYREGVKLKGHAVVGGAAQTVISMLLFVFRLIQFFRGPTEIARVLLEEADRRPVEQPLELPTPAIGILLIAEFLSKPLNMFLLYMFFEGLARTVAAAAGEAVGSLPLYIISGAHRLWERARHKRELGPLVVDEVVRGGEKQKYDLKVYSCRPKLHWNPYMTIEFEGEFYQMYDEEPGTSPRRFVYYLRKNPVGRIVVTVDHYKPDDILKPRPDKWDGTPRIRDVMKPQRKRPVVADELVRGGHERQGYDLKIYSCKPKPDWNYYITVDFEGQLYQMFKEEPGPEPRPFVFYLRKNPIGRQATVIRPYKPDDVLNG